MKKPKILVVGSMVMDLIVSSPRFPDSGETVMGIGFQTATGGKGANQAVQAAKLGADVTMVGRVGDDGFGKEMVEALKSYGLNTDHIIVDKEASTSVGNVQLEVKPGEKSKNRIIVVPGANHTIVKDDVAFLEESISDFDMVILQLEIPMEINELVASYAKAKGVPVMLNSAPSAPLSDEFLANLTYISPNEHEAEDITGLKIKKEGKTIDLDSVKAVIAAIKAKGVDNAIITLGSAGAAYSDDDDFLLSPSIDVVEVKDPTAAGDSFVGSFCTAVSAGLDPFTAIEFSNYVATITVSKMGAQPSLPTLKQVNDFMKEMGFNKADALVSALEK